MIRSATFSALSVFLAIGMLGLVSWLPWPVRQLFLVSRPSAVTCRNYFIGVTGSACFVGQLLLLFFVYRESLLRLPPINRSLALSAVAVAILLFGGGATNFVWTIAHLRLKADGDRN
jgi:hypothetical protein